MKRMMMAAAILACAIVAVGLAGCGTDTGNTKSQGGKTNGGQAKSGDHADHDHADHDDEMEEVRAELAKLSDQDRASAEKQKTCPVSEKLLGSMGAPLQVAVGDEHVWICCKGCQDDLLKEPEKFLAKLKRE